MSTIIVGERPIFREMGKDGKIHHIAILADRTRLDLDAAPVESKPAFHAPEVILADVAKPVNVVKLTFVPECKPVVPLVINPKVEKTKFVWKSYEDKVAK